MIIDARSIGNEFAMMNHADNPSVQILPGIIDGEFGRFAVPLVVTIADIQIREELTISYDLVSYGDVRRT
jgi:hypothetical protein